jgi:hypothetical protein
MRVFYVSVLPVLLPKHIGSIPPLLADVEHGLGSLLIPFLLDDVRQDHPFRFEEFFLSHNTVFLQTRQDTKGGNGKAISARSPPPGFT